ncbi:MAG: hybrid sensor histidine kinase/response regulator [Cyanobacteria bacterium SZAS-4]|nr:hybrid sensor histidine kinase/response regulator [Cyanobacteria bacterium SZAS-4]
MTNQTTSIQVLLIENDCVDAKQVLDLLHQRSSNLLDLSVTWVMSLADGINELTTRTYDSVLLNLGLPDSDGIDTLLQVRRCSKTIPIVILSGSDDKNLALESVQNGAQDFLVKGRPSAESILRAIQYSIERCRADRAVMQLRLLEEREHFIAMLAHKLSIPIMGAQRILSILIELGTMSDDVRNLLSQISSSNQTLLHTIHNVLDLYRYETGFDTFVQTDVNVGRLVADVLRELTATAAMKKIRFIKSYSPSDTLFADPLAMRKVMLNLLSNAVKFTPEGGSVTISCKSAAGKSVLSVTDTGIGVEPELVDLIFERSFQKTRRYQPDGFGIGLDLCKRFVEEQNGNIVCHSKLSKGTTIKITLPQMPNVTALNRERVSLCTKPKLVTHSLG